MEQHEGSNPLEGSITVNGVVKPCVCARPAEHDDCKCEPNARFGYVFDTQTKKFKLVKGRVRLNASVWPHSNSIQNTKNFSTGIFQSNVLCNMNKKAKK